MLRLAGVLLIAYLTSVILATSQGRFPAVVIDGYNASKSIDSPANLPLGTTLVLVCRVSGIPHELLQSHTKYDWKCNNESCTQEYGGREIRNNNTTLAINITSMSNSGTYTCTVFPEGRKEISGQFHLNVTGGKVVHSYGRLIMHEGVISDRRQLQPPNNASGNGGIECRVINGEAKFAYYGYNVSTDTSKDVYQTGDDGGLNAVVIKQEARNFAIEGKCAGLFHYLFLKNDTICNELAFDIPTVNHSSITVNISKLPDGIARAIVGYTRLDLGVPVEGEFKNLQECETRTFSSLAPGTKYRITAWGLSGGKTNNRKRCQSPTVREVSTSPQHSSPPRNVTITRIFQQGIQLNWIPPKEPNGDIMCYNIKYTTPDGVEQTVDTPGNINYYNLKNLMIGQNYTIRVAAYNSITGLGEESDVTHYVHKEVQARILSVWANKTYEGGRSTLTVSWTSNSIEAAITHYKVSYFVNSNNVTHVTTEISSVVLDDLGVPYRVLVVPYTEFRAGVSSQWIIVGSMSGGVPEPVTNVNVTNSASAGMSSLLLVWDPQNIDPPIVQYELQFRDIFQIGETWSQKNISGTSNSTVLEYLDPGVIYGVRMRAVSKLGRGEWGPMFYRKTYDVPGKISSWKVTPILSKGTAALCIEWEEPDSDVEIITYEVKVNLGGNVMETNTSHTNYTIKGLETSTEYKVTVAAISIIGRGAESAVQGKYPSTQIPSIVTFKSNLTKVSESEMDLYIDVLRYGELQSQITLTVKDEPLSASRSDDYVLQTEHLSFVQVSKMMEKATIVIKIIDDIEEETKEEFKLTLITERGDNVLYIAKEMTICIEDDDMHMQVSR